MTAPMLPDSTQRLRCAGCGNLTRFDVRRSSRTQEYWHVDLAGHSRVEAAETIAEEVEAITCRWCGRSDAIEVVARADAGGEDLSRG